MSKRNNSKSEASGSKGMTFYEACLKVLNESDKAMTAKQLSDEIMRQRLVMSHGATPAHTIRGRLYEKMKKGKTNICCYKQDGQTYYYIKKKHASPSDEDEEQEDEDEAEDENEDESKSKATSKKRSKKEGSSSELEDHDESHSVIPHNSSVPIPPSSSSKRANSNLSDDASTQPSTSSSNMAMFGKKSTGNGSENTVAIDALLQLSSICEGNIESSSSNGSQQLLSNNINNTQQLYAEDQQTQSRKRQRKPVVRYQDQFQMDPTSLPPKRRHTMRLRSSETCNGQDFVMSSTIKHDASQLMASVAIASTSSMIVDDDNATTVSSLHDSSPEREEIKSAQASPSHLHLPLHQPVLQAQEIVEPGAIVSSCCSNNSATTAADLVMFADAPNLYWLMQNYRASVNFNGLKRDQILDSSYTFR